MIYRFDSDRKLLVLSSLISVAFSVMYAQVEIWLDWRKVLQAFSSLPDLKGFPAYNWLFTNLLFLLVAFSPLIPLAVREGISWKIVAMGLGNFFLICVVEDAFYFILQGRWITPEDNTAKVLGSFMAGDLLIPAWYAVYIVLALYLYSEALSSSRPAGEMRYRFRA